MTSSNRMFPSSAPAVPVAPWHLAVLMFAAMYLGAPAAHVVARTFNLTDRDIAALSQVTSFSLGAAAIVTIPWLRKRAQALLAEPCPRSRYGEVALAIAIAAMGEFALFGLRALVRWIEAGDAAVIGMSLGSAHAAGEAFAASTLRTLAISCLAAPLIEEIFYRGTLFEAFASRRRIGSAMLLSSAVFASVHPTPLHAFFGGLLLCAVYVRTGSLRASILVHFCANAFNWYPVLGQFVIPPENHGIGSWSVHLACLATAPLIVVGYAGLAARSPRSGGGEETRAILA